MSSTGAERTLQTLVEHAWDREVTWGEIQAWAENFTGATAAVDKERAHALVALSRFIYFGRRLVREMLRSLYRDHFEAPLIQRVRRNLRGALDSTAVRTIYKQELSTTRFLGVGNPSESGAHLLYYFRQVNHLPKDLFMDLGTAFTATLAGKSLASLKARDQSVTRYIFFDDLVGSAQQSTAYLGRTLSAIRRRYRHLDLRFMSLFATTGGLAALNQPQFFGGKASSLFELDDSYKAFDSGQRYFPATASPDFDLTAFHALASHYGARLFPGYPLGYRDGQLLLGFTHNTPDNALPIFWNEGRVVPWRPIFVRYDKVY